MTETTTTRTNNWGRWGDDDERGALNLLTPEVVKAAAASITTGKVYSLGIPIQGQGVPLMDYRGTPMRLTLQDSTDDGIYEQYGCHTGTGAHEDVLVMASHTTSHMDALVHVYGDYKHYNGVEHDTMHALGGAQKLGIDKVGGFAARAVLLDMVAYFGDEKYVTLGRNITAADLQGAAAKQGTEVRAGDVVLVRTGYLQFWFENNAAGSPPPFEQAGIGGDAARWLAVHGHRRGRLRQRRRRGHPLPGQRLPARPQGPARRPRHLPARVHRPLRSGGRRHLRRHHRRRAR